MKRIISILLVTMLLATLFTGCSSKTKDEDSSPSTDNSSDNASTSSTDSSADTSSASEEKVIKLGLLAPLTGTNAEYGKGFEIATAIAIDEINSAGGVNGYKLEIEVADSKGDQKESSDLARKFADDEEIKAIIGDFASGCCMANAPIIDEAGIVQLSPTASNPDYASMSDYAFGIMGRQDVEAPFFAKYICKQYLQAESVAIIYINSDWGVSSRDNFMKGAEEVGLNVVAEANYVQDEKDFSSLILKLQAAKPEVVIIFDQGAVPSIVNQIAQIGWEVQICALGPGTSQQIIDLCGDNAEGLITSTPFFFDPNNAEQTTWKANFVEKAGFEPSVHPVVAYDCVYLIEKAIEMIGDGEVTRQAIRDNLQNAEITGLAGAIKFSEDGDIARNYLICAVEGGEFVIKEGYEYSAE